MLIENVDALKTWLTKTLEPICDADPFALAKYVIALVKKDKTEKELKALCVDQLDVFLQKDTQVFVDKLFDAVNAKSYLPPVEQPSLGVVKPVAAQRQEKEDKKEEAAKDEERDKKFSKRVNHSPPSSSRYRDNRGRDDRKKDERPRKREYDRNISRRESYRDRYNRRRGRSRSYSRSRSRSWSKERLRERDRSRSRSRSRSRERDPGKPKYEPERTDPSGNDYSQGASSVPAISSGHYPISTLSSTVTVIAPSHHANTTASWSEFPEDHIDPNSYGTGSLPKKRCRDYDEKGFCMRGDMCPFDHGSDPVVVEKVTLPGMLPFPTQPPVVEGPPPPGLPPPPPMLTPPPVNLRPPVPPPGPLPPSLPPVTGLPPPLPPLQPSGMDAPPNSVTSAVPTVVTSVIHHPPPPAPPPLYTTEGYDADGYNPEAPSITNTSRPVYRHRVHAQRPNLIGLTTGDMDLPPRVPAKLPEKPVANNSMRIVVDSDSSKRMLGTREGVVPAKKPWFDNRQSPCKTGTQIFPKKVPYSGENTRLSLRRVPSELNNISKLNEHFSKFGTIVNLQVACDGDPEGALIQFATHEEAKRAISSTEAVLNNRFIKVFWYREGGDTPQVQGQNHKVSQTAQQTNLATVKQSVKDRLGPVPGSVVEPAEAQGTKIDAASNSDKVSVKERLGFASAPAPATVTTEKVLSTSSGLTKTVYNPAALKAAQKTLSYSSSVLDSSDAQKKKQEALRLQQDVIKKKQEILEKHIETQKILIAKLEKNKSMKPEDKAEIMKTLETLTNSITKLNEELKTLSSGGVIPKCVKTKAQMQKELLDTELDLFTKMQAGEDVAELRKKYTELQLEAAKRGILASNRGRGGHIRGRGVTRGRGRGRGRGIRGRGRGVPVHAVVDHRPRALEISAFSESDREDLLPHFAQFGGIEDCQIDDTSLHAIITYRTRAEAEVAAIHGARFKGQDLKMHWYKPCNISAAVEQEDVEQEEEEFTEDTLLDDPLLQDDDEEEEDNESRPWRR
ncbi:RNA-binding protein 26 isoform X2 [Protopterus annectens]|uniref:RNA-binding protein 26 isoform X2 n=1 Tax=Protopterus annectens TaxID=7888 RepID=UPI001CFA8A82|nr:RNA-binding protein 26 isoform X2 [Protopterus annectens]